MVLGSEVRFDLATAQRELLQASNRKGEIGEETGKEEAEEAHVSQQFEVAEENRRGGILEEIRVDMHASYG